MNILGTDKYRSTLADAIENCQRQLTLVSAYLTVGGIGWVLDKLPEKTDCRVLSRWDPRNLLNGASDIEVYKKLRERNYPLHILQDLHAKVAIIDDETLFIGSANITKSGLKLAPGGNKELGTTLSPDKEDLELIESLFTESTLVNEELYQEFYKELQSLKEKFPEPIPKLKWSDDLQLKLFKPPNRLWVTEMLWTDEPKELLKNVDSKEAIHDLILLGFSTPSDKTPSIDDLQVAFLHCRSWRWLKHKLEAAESSELYFGELSALLHDSFLDDPTPYRKKVKDLLSNLLKWAKHLGNNSIKIDRPNHSQRVQLRIHSK